MNHLTSAEWATAGSFTWNVPANVNIVWVTALGGGAGGEHDLNANKFGGFGGGAGEFISMMTYRVTASGTVAVIVGAGGTKGFYSNHTAPSGAVAAGQGGNSSFGSLVALGGGRNALASLAGYGGGPKGGKRGNEVTPLFSELYGFPESARWFGGSGGGAPADPVHSPNLPGMDGGPAGGRLKGGTGGATSGVSVPPPGPGGGGAATLYGVGGNGGDDYLDGNAATKAGTGGGAAGGTDAALGVGPFHDGAAGFDGYVAVFWIDPN